MNENVLESEEVKFMKQYYPQAYTEFLLYQRRDRLPKVGSEVVVLLDSFYHTWSREMIITSITDEKFFFDDSCLNMPIDRWWRNTRIVKEVE